MWTINRIPSLNAPINILLPSTVSFIIIKIYSGIPLAFSLRTGKSKISSLAAVIKFFFLKGG